LTTNAPDCSASSTGAQRSENDTGAAGAYIPRVFAKNIVPSAAIAIAMIRPNRLLI
jgi:hypothetical protein